MAAVLVVGTVSLYIYSRRMQKVNKITKRVHPEGSPNRNIMTLTAVVVVEIKAMIVSDGQKQ
jgi:hypothetical protein